MSHMLHVRWRHRWRDITHEVRWVNFFKVRASPVSIRICMPNLVAVRRSCRKKRGGTDRRPDRQTDKGTLQLYLYINLRRSRDCLCMSVAAGRPVWVILSCVCLRHRAASFTYYGKMLRCPHKRIVTITKVYIARNTIYVEIIRFHTN